MKPATPTAHSSLPLPPSTYIYKILPLSPPTSTSPSPSTYLAALSSDNSLRLIDVHTLQQIPDGVLENVDGGAICVERDARDANVLLTAGRDGVVRGWDVRMGGEGRGTGKVVEFMCGGTTKTAYLSLCSRENGPVVGTELTNSQASVLIWDKRNPKQPILQYTESHNDDITVVSPHPTVPKILLSGSTDGLLNIYSTLHTDEDDALLQVVNHGRSIHHAGFLSEDRFFGISHDEHLGVYALDEGQEGGGTGDVMFGDLRERLEGCEYVVDVVVGGGGGSSAIVGAASHTRQQMDLVPLCAVSGTASWDFESPDNTIRLPGAHGEEVVRSMCFIDQSIFTAGEDGKIRSWRVGESGNGEEMEVEGVKSEKVRKKTKKKKRESVGAGEGKGRFKPY